LSLSAGLTNHVISIDEEMVRTALHHIIMLSSAQELRIRMILDLSIHPGEIFICTEPLRIPSAKDYEEGVNVVTIPMHRVNPRAKLTGFIHSASNIRATLPAGVNEALMVDENSMVLEGLSSNFFAVRNNSLWNAEEGVLPGITRCVVLAVAEQIGIPIILSPISVQEFETIDEAFITSTSRAILPVVSVDGKKIGDGKPGDITKELMVKFQEEIQAELEEI
jgi:branched-chain amino acid aminotransferase